MKVRGSPGRLAAIVLAACIVFAAPRSRADEPNPDRGGGLSRLIEALLEPAAVGKTARFPADILKAVIGAGLQPTGTVTAVYEFPTGEGANRVVARLQIVDVGAVLPGISETLHAVRGSATLTSSALSIHEISGKWGDGAFRLSGRLTLERLAPVSVELNLTSQELPVTIPGVMRARAGGALLLSGPIGAPRLTGEVRLVSGTWVRDTLVTIPGRSIEPAPVTAPVPDPAPGESGFLERAGLDIQVRHQEPFWVHNNLARFSLVPELRIGWTVRRPSLAGRALVEEGEISYQNKRFEIEKGGVEFTDPYKTDPVVNLTGKGKFRKWLVSLAFRGSPEALNLTLSSEPPLEEPDIISLLVVGRTSEDLIAKEGSSPVSTSKVLAGLIDSEYGAKFKKTTGLDILEAENIPDRDIDEPDRVRFTIGENLSQRMTLKYATETRKGMFIQEFISEYKLLDKLLMSGYQDTEGAYGAGLLYRMEFK